MNGQMGRWADGVRCIDGGGKASQSRHCCRAARRVDARRRKGSASGAWGGERSSHCFGIRSCLVRTFSSPPKGPS